MSSNIENLLSDFADLEPFARQFNRHPRTVRRWMTEPDGLPFTRVGNRILVHLPSASAWILRRMRTSTPPSASRRLPTKPARLLLSPGASSSPCTQQRSSSHG